MAATVSVSVRGGETLLRHLEELAEAKGLVKAGIMEGSRNYAEVIEYAPSQEFGAQIEVTPKMRKFLAYNFDIHLRPDKTHIIIPPRPFMRTTFEEHWQEWVELLAGYLRSGVAPEIALEYVGIRMQDDIIAKIKSNMPPPLSDATKKIKSMPEQSPENADRTLYHSGQLAHSIDYEVIPE